MMTYLYRASNLKVIVSCDLISESEHSLCRDGTHRSIYQYQLPDNVSANPTSEGFL